MSWICPYCGTENYRDERVGRQEPRCRQCKVERITPEELEKLKEKTMGKLEGDRKQLRDQVDEIRASIEFHQSIIDEHTGPLAELKNDLEELRDEVKPIIEALKKWENQPVFFEEKDRALKAEQDKYQMTLPFEEVPICA
jgi:chromosome segregation ATPase